MSSGTPENSQRVHRRTLQVYRRTLKDETAVQPEKRCRQKDYTY